MCNQIIMQKADLIKEIFVNLIAVSSYPCVGLMDYGDFVVKCRIKEDSLGCNQSAIDRTFIAAKIQKGGSTDSKVENGIGNAMQRYEFFEVIVRLAQMRYKDP